MLTSLQLIRDWLKTNGFSAFVIPSNDPHFSEYVAERWKVRQWASGFTGSAGTLVVTCDKAALWTDSRYFLQAAHELSGSGIELMRLMLEGTPSIGQWLLSVLPSQAKVGVDGLLFSRSEFDRLGREVAPLRLEALDDPFDEIWPQRPGLPRGKAFIWDQQYAGESTPCKIRRLRERLGMTENRVFPVVALDEIAWLLNIRGTDVAYNPVVIAYLALENDRVVLFVDAEKFPGADRHRLQEEGIEMLPYGDFDAYLRGLSAKEVLVTPQLGQSHFQILSEGDVVVHHLPSSEIAAMKGIKNPTEQAGFRRAMVEDGVALVRFEMWLENVLTTRETITETDIAARLYELRSQSPLFRGESFATIAGYAGNGAVIHYHAQKETAAQIRPQGFLLVDSGAQYLCGTTDITRTYHLSDPSEEEKADYTAVLQGMIDLSTAVFPQGTRGTQLDVLARSWLWKRGTNYLYGTGHGIGCFLNVHEGPQSIRMNENPVTLQPGMVTSNEPGIYRTDRYGIRIENLLLCREKETTGYGTFYDFETLTLCPIDLRALDPGLLLPHQRQWLNAYHQAVYDALSPQLDAREKEWLRKKTAPLCG